MELYLSLGSNLGDKEANIRLAIDKLSSRLGSTPVKVSELIRTKPWGFDSEDDFLNCAAEYECAMDPVELLAVCKDVEREVGRIPQAPQYDSEGKRIYKSRIIDIDIIVYGNLEINTPQLTIPHPLMKERDFVMIGLHELDPEKFKFNIK